MFSSMAPPAGPDTGRGPFCCPTALKPKVPRGVLRSTEGAAEPNATVLGAELSTSVSEQP